MKKILAVLLALAMVLSFAACGGSTEKEPGAKALKAGFIFLHDENSTYDKNFLTAAEEACKEMGVEIVKKVNIPESAACKDAAAELVDDGCTVIFADSFGHEDFMIQAAKEFPEIQFCHATGVKAHTEKLANYHNAFASIYEGRYLAGIAAGMKLNEMIADGKFKAEEAKMGYVGAFTYAEVISGYTSFYLGAKSVCPTVTMEVQFTGSWYDETAEKEAANKLLADGCKLISQHADSMGAPSACELAGVPDVSYNGSTQSACPKTYIISSRINWVPYFKYMIECVQKGEAIDTDWTGTLKTESVVLTDLNTDVAAEGTQAKIDEAKAAFEAGTLHVFDTAKEGFITIDGKPVTSHLVEEQEVVKDGYFHESEIQSAPYFDLRIDGIKLLNEKF